MPWHMWQAMQISVALLYSAIRVFLHRDGFPEAIQTQHQTVAECETWNDIIENY